MGRKKKRPPPSPFSRIFCYYCDRNFTDEQTLLSHQREKHLRCPTCYKRMLSVPSMTIHASQMHNVTLTAVPNAIPSRSNISVDVLGMKGIPDSYYASISQQGVQPPSKLSRTSSYPNAAHSQQSHLNLRNAPAHPNHPQHQYHQPYQSYASSSHLNPHQYPRHQQPHNPTYPAGYPHQPAAPVSQHPHLHRQHSVLYNSKPPPSHHSPAHYPYSRPHPSAPVLHPPPQPARFTHAVSIATRSTNSTPSRPVPTPSQNLSRQAYGPSKPPEPTLLPSAPTTAAKSFASTQPPVQGSQQRPTSLSAPWPATTPEIKVVFDRLDMSMEELRAQLPRYKVE